MTNRFDNHPRNQVRVRAVIQNGKVVSAESAAAAQQVADELEHQKERAERRRRLWGEGGDESMVRLCRLFPALRNKRVGTGAWDATEVLRFLCQDAYSHGEALAARFVLSVWNSNTDWEQEARKAGLLTDPDQHVRRFDLFEALGTWDEEHCEAMLTWLRDPFWP